MKSASVGGPHASLLSLASLALLAFGGASPGSRAAHLLGLGCTWLGLGLGIGLGLGLGAAGAWGV